MVKSKNLGFFSKDKNIDTRLSFLIFNARLIFIKLKETFIKALIFYRFDLNCNI